MGNIKPLFVTPLNQDVRIRASRLGGKDLKLEVRDRHGGMCSVIVPRS